MNYVYQTKARKQSQTTTFLCSMDVQLGAYAIQEGEPIKVVSRTANDFYVYVEWAEDAIGIYTARTINKLAGYEAVQ